MLIPVICNYSWVELTCSIPLKKENSILRFIFFLLKTFWLRIIIMWPTKTFQTFFFGRKLKLQLLTLKNGFSVAAAKRCCKNTFFFKLCFDLISKVWQLKEIKSFFHSWWQLIKVEDNARSHLSSHSRSLVIVPNPTVETIFFIHCSFGSRHGTKNFSLGLLHEQRKKPLYVITLAHWYH